MSTLSYKCPACGAPLIYEGRKQEMQCGSCGNTFESEAVRQAAEIKQEDAGFEDMSWDIKDEGFSEKELERTNSFSCSSCGAQLITDETTVATNCAFCGSPSVIPSQFTLGTKPESIIPFLIDKKQAENDFHNYFKGRKLIPNLFLKGKNVIDEIRQLYVPYWLFDCDADAKMTYKASTISVIQSGQYRVSTTRHFLIRRAGSLSFRQLPVDSSSRLDNKITESIEPFNTDTAIEFSPETLSGALANRADVNTDECQTRANDRVRKSTEDAFRRTVSGYSAVIPESSSIRIQNGRAWPVLYPIWLITTKKDNVTYTFAINGQTGALTCNIPMSLSKFFGRFLSLTAAIAIGGSVIVYALASMGVFK